MNSSRDTLIRDALRRAAGNLEGRSESPRLDAELLFAHALQRTRAWLYANPDTALTPAQATACEALIEARRRGKPVAQLTGRREFWSLPLEVNEHTLVPRPETELLVETALGYIGDAEACRVLELGTGSGAIAVAIATERPGCAVTATDSSAPALAVATRNAGRHCPDRIAFHTGDWYAALPSGTALFDIIISNPPYIAAGETALTDRELAWEPQTALYSGIDGLDATRQIVAGAADWLKPGGRLLLEHGFAQHTAVTELLHNCDFEAVESVADLAGNPRVTHGTLKHRGKA